MADPVVSHVAADLLKKLLLKLVESRMAWLRAKITEKIYLTSRLRDDIRISVPDDSPCIRFYISFGVPQLQIDLQVENLSPYYAEVVLHRITLDVLGVDFTHYDESFMRGQKRKFSTVRAITAEQKNRVLDVISKQNAGSANPNKTEIKGSAVLLCGSRRVQKPVSLYSIIVPPPS